MPEEHRFLRNYFEESMFVKGRAINEIELNKIWCQMYSCLFCLPALPSCKEFLGGLLERNYSLYPLFCSSFSFLLYIGLPNCQKLLVFLLQKKTAKVKDKSMRTIMILEKNYKNNTNITLKSAQLYEQGI